MHEYKKETKAEEFVGWFSSIRVRSYLILLLLIGVFLFKKLDDPQHEEIKNNLIPELAGTLITIIVVDGLMSIKNRKNQKHEAYYRLYVTHQLLYPHLSKHFQFIRSISTKMGDSKDKDVSQIEFTDLMNLYNRHFHSDSPKDKKAYHLYFETLFKALEEIHKAIYFLNPIFLLDVIGIFENILVNNEKAQRLYNLLIERERSGNFKYDVEFFEDIKKGEIDQTVEFISSNPHILNPYAQLYYLTIKNVELFFRFGTLVQERLTEFKSPDGKLVNFELD